MSVVRLFAITRTPYRVISYASSRIPASSAELRSRRQIGASRRNHPVPHQFLEERLLAAGRGQAVPAGEQLGAGHVALGERVEQPRRFDAADPDERARDGRSGDAAARFDDVAYDARHVLDRDLGGERNGGTIDE